MSIHQTSNVGAKHNPMDEDTSYSNGSVISYPAAAASFSSPPNSHLKFAPPGELTPPPSPQQSSTASGFIFAPGLLTRAGSVISKRQSTASSPTRQSTHAQSQSSTASTRAQATGQNLTLAGESTTSLDTQQRRRKGAKSTAFADFFSGSSELVSSFGVSPTKRSETSPTRAISGHQQRPSLSRSSGVFTSAAASLFTRPSRATSPIKVGALSRRMITEEDSDDGGDEEDEILNLDLEDELFPGGDAEGLGGAAEAFDTLFANAERLFMRMQIAYQGKRSLLTEARGRSRVEREECEEARERNEHLKSQLDVMSRKVREQEEMMSELAEELAKERTLRQKEAGKRLRSLRVVGDAGDGGRARGRRDDSEDRSSLDSDNDASDAGAIWSRPESPSSASISTMPDEIDVSGFAPGAFGGGLREENMRLKARVAELEETVDGCLGLVHNL